MTRAEIVKGNVIRKLSLVILPIPVNTTQYFQYNHITGNHGINPVIMKPLAANYKSVSSCLHSDQDSYETTVFKN